MTTIREVLKRLRETYCGTIGAEYMHCTEPTEKRWWQQRLESIRSKPTFDVEEKVHILDRLTAAEGLERYLHTKYVGQKRFSLEGAESLIPLMDAIVDTAAGQGLDEVEGRGRHVLELVGHHVHRRPEGAKRVLVLPGGRGRGAADLEGGRARVGVGHGRPPIRRLLPR